MPDSYRKRHGLFSAEDLVSSIYPSLYVRHLLPIPEASISSGIYTTSLKRKEKEEEKVQPSKTIGTSSSNRNEESPFPVFFNIMEMK